MRTANFAKAMALSHDVLAEIVAEGWNRSDDNRLRKTATKRELDDANGFDELSQVEQARLFEMPTLLPADVRVTTDAGVPDWKPRDEATPKEISAHYEYREDIHLRAAGIERRKGEKFDGWLSEQGSTLDHEQPIGPYVYRDIRCAICGEGFKENDPFEMAHDVAVALGGGDGSTHWAHRSCNRSEGVG